MLNEAIALQALAEIKKIKKTLITELSQKLSPMVLKELKLLDKKGKPALPPLPYSKITDDPPQIGMIKGMLNIIHHAELELHNLTLISSKDTRKLTGKAQTLIPKIKMVWDAYLMLDALVTLTDIIPTQATMIAHFKLIISDFVKEKMPENMLERNLLDMSIPGQLPLIRYFERFTEQFDTLSSEELSDIKDKILQAFQSQLPYLSLDNSGFDPQKLVELLDILALLKENPAAADGKAAYLRWLEDHLTSFLSILDRVEQDNGLRTGVLSQPLLTKLEKVHQTIQTSVSEAIPPLSTYIRAKERQYHTQEALAFHRAAVRESKVKYALFKLFFKLIEVHSTVSFYDLSKRPLLRNHLRKGYFSIQKELAESHPGLDKLMVKALNGEFISKEEYPLLLKEWLTYKEELLTTQKLFIHSSNFKYKSTRESLGKDVTAPKHIQMRTKSLHQGIAAATKFPKFTKLTPHFPEAESVLSISEQKTKSQLERDKISKIRGQLEETNHRILTGLKQTLHPDLLKQLKLHLNSPAKLPYSILKKDSPEVMSLKGLLNALYHAQAGLLAYEKSLQIGGVFQRLKNQYYSFQAQRHSSKTLTHMHTLRTQSAQLRLQQHVPIANMFTFPAIDSLQAANQTWTMLNAMQAALLQVNKVVEKGTQGIASWTNFIALLQDLPNWVTDADPNNPLWTERIRQSVAFLAQLSPLVDTQIEKAGLISLKDFLGTLEKHSPEEMKVFINKWLQEQSELCLSALQRCEMHWCLSPGLLQKPVQDMLIHLSDRVGIKISFNLAIQKSQTLKEYSQQYQSAQISTVCVSKFFKLIESMSPDDVKKSIKLNQLVTYFDQFKHDLKQLNPHLHRCLEKALNQEKGEKWLSSELWQAEDVLLTHYGSIQKSAKLHAKLIQGSAYTRLALSSHTIERQMEKMMEEKLSISPCKMNFWGKPPQEEQSKRAPSEPSKPR